MRYINHLSDFQVIINIKDKDGNIIAPPSVPWEAVFSDENCVEFKCYFDGNNYTHCIVDGNDIVCFIDNPGFSCGKLRCTFYQHVPSAEYCDGVMDLSQPLQCDIMLSKRESDDSTPITIEASPNWVRGPQGEKGEKGDKGDTGNQGPIGQTGPQGIQGIQGIQGDKGADGFSPIVSLTKQGTISTLSITDAQGEHTTEIADGAKGDDGLSPIVSLNKVDKVTTLTITDASGEHTATVNDGESVEVVQSTGTSETAVMSQKAVSDALSNSGFALLYELGFSDLRHFYASRVDSETATYYVDDGIPEWVRTCPMLNNRYALNIDRFFNDNNISIGRKKYTKHIKSSYVWIEIIDNNSFVAYNAPNGTQLTQIGDVSTIGEFAFCEIAKGFKLDITGFSTVVFEIDKSVKNVLSSMYGLNGQMYSDLSVYRERGNKYYSPAYNVNYIRGYILTPCVATSSYSNIINIKRDNGNLEIEQAKINSSTLEIASTVNTVYENSVPLINPIVSDIQDEEKLYLSPYVYNYSAPLPYIPHTTIKVYGKK